MEDRPRRDRGLVAASTAHQEASRGGPAAAGRTLGTTEPRRPSQLSQVGTARTFCGETLFELGKDSHIVLPGVTPARLGRTGVKCTGFSQTKNIQKRCMENQAPQNGAPTCLAMFVSAQIMTSTIDFPVLCSASACGLTAAYPAARACLTYMIHERFCCNRGFAALGREASVVKRGTEGMCQIVACEIRDTLHEERVFLAISSLDCARDPELCRRATNRHESCGLT